MPVRRLLSVAVVGVLFAGVAHALTLQFVNEGKRVAWLADSFGGAPPAEAAVSEAKVTLADDKSKPWCYVLDLSTGRAARRKVADVKGSWTVKDTDFNLIGKVTVVLTHAEKPVSAAQVVLTTGSESYSGLLAPADVGTLSFYCLPTGPAKLKITYRSKGTTQELVPRPMFDLALPKDGQPVVLPVSITAAVDTVAPDAEPKAHAQPAAKDAPAQPNEGQSLLGRVIAYILGFGVVAAVLYYGTRYLTGNIATVNQNLAKIGVQIPEDPAEPDETAPPPPTSSRRAEPVPQIVLDSAPLDPVAPIATAPVVSNPRLVFGSGEIRLIADGTTTVGREAPADWVMPGEPSLSRRHAEFNRSGDVVRLKDLGSTNGTYVNGDKLGVDDRILEVGDAVQFGAASFRFEK